MTIYLREPNSYGTVVQFELGEILLHRRTEYQEVLIADTPAYGLTLFLDGIVQSCVADDPIYHETMVHPAMIVHGDAKNVLVGGTGEGASVREVLRHPSVRRVLTCDLDDGVVQAVREHLPMLCEGVFEDPRVDYRVEDVQKTVAEARDGEFDVIFMDVTDPTEDGPAVDLFAVSWFEKIARVLADDGLLVYQSGEMDVVDMIMPRTVRTTIEQVLPWTWVLHHYVPSFHAFWTWTLAARRPFEMRPADLAARIERLGRENLRVYTESAHHTMIELPPYMQKIMDEPGKIVRGKVSDLLWVYPNNASA